MPQRTDVIEGFLDDMAEVEVYFCLEALSGKGRLFLSQMIEEAKIFQKTTSIKYDQVSSYEDLFNLMKEQTAPF